jgi:hypothetical protein
MKIGVENPSYSLPVDCILESRGYKPSHSLPVGEDCILDNWG